MSQIILSDTTRAECHSRAFIRGNEAFNAGLWNQAIIAYTEALQYHETPDVLTNLGFIYRMNGMLMQAAKMHKRAMELDPFHAKAANGLADSLADMLQPEKGLSLKKRALELYPVNDRQGRYEAHAQLIFTATTVLPFSAYTQAMADFCQQHLSVTPRPAVMPLGVENRKIRLGYLSGDFNRHTVMVLLEPLFSHFDSDRFSLYLYSNTDKPDDRTEQLKQVGHWRDISKRNDRQAANLIANDKLDLLVDLSGYSSGHRLSLLARKPSPRIATGLGFITPINHPAIDFAILDQSMVPDSQAHLICEQLARIPTNMYYRPEPEIPLQKPDRQGVVFGSANSLFKVGAPVIECWAHILRYTPHSTLSLKAKGLSDPEVLAVVKGRFEAQGIDPNRITGSGQATRREFMEWYHGVDICLDPFPYQGGVTTSEALYMGCPVLACNAGGVNTTVSILRACGMEEYIASTPENYVRLAVGFGSKMAGFSPDTRMFIRQEIRDRISNSIVFDAQHFARSMESAYEWMIDQPPRGERKSG